MEVVTPGTQTPPKATPFNGRVSEAASSAHGAVDKAATAANTAAKAITPAIDHAAALGHQTINKVENTVAPAERWVHEKTDALLAAPRNAMSDAREYIIAHPWKSVGAAVVVGILLGRKSS